MSDRKLSKLKAAVRPFPGVVLVGGISLVEPNVVPPF